MNKNQRAVLAEFIRQNESLSYQAIANLHHCHAATIRNVAAEFEIRRKVGRKHAPIAVCSPCDITEVNNG